MLDSAFRLRDKAHVDLAQAFSQCGEFKVAAVKRSLLRAGKSRAAGRKAKQLMLNEFCLDTGCHRKYAIRLLKDLSRKTTRAVAAPTSTALRAPNNFSIPAATRAQQRLQP